MKNAAACIAVFFALCCCLTVAAQDGPLFSKNYTPSFTTGNVKKYIKDIEGKTNTRISFSAQYVDLKRKVSVQPEATTVYNALQQILAGQKVLLQESGDKILLLPANGSSPFAPGNVTINGYVKDAINKEVLIGAVVYVPELGKGTVTNSYGYYSLVVPAGPCRVLCAYIGYVTDSFARGSTDNARRDVLLATQARLAEVSIVHEKENAAGHLRLSYSDIKSRPVILGENDVMRALQNIPGVQSGTDGSNAVVVRGGDPGQNLNLLDGVPLYYIDHFFGFTSVYNSEAIKAVDFYKGAFPSRYGGRLSSVIDVSTKDGDMSRWGGQFTMGLVKSSLNVEGPIVKDKASIMLSARRTWLDLLWRPYTSAVTANFYDINAKANVIINKNNRMYLSVYNGRDGLGYVADNGKTKASWGNTVSSLKWNSIVNPKLFVNTTLTYSRFRFYLEDTKQLMTQYAITSTDAFEGHSSINDLALRVHANWYATAYQRIEFGAHYSKAKFVPAEVSANNFQNITTITPADKFQSDEFVFFAEDEIKINNKWLIRLGLHFANWFSTRFNYSGLQPRFYTSYKLGQHYTVHASYAKMAQFLHLISNNTYGLPTDFWLPSSSIIEPEVSSLVTAGYSAQHRNAFTYSIEGYYKDIENTTTYGIGKNLFDNSLKWDKKIIQGRGWSYGAEVFAKIKAGPLTFSTGYTLSWTWRKFAQLNEGKPFPYRFDRRHNIRTTLSYQPSEKFDATASWTYMTGEAITLPDQLYPDFDNNLLISPAPSTASADYTYNYVAWNNYRLPPIHRLDIGFNFTKRKRKYRERIWSLGVFNAYARHNVMFVDLVYEGGYGSSNFKLKGVSFLQFVPYLGYKLKF